MANHKSAEKRARRAKRRTAINTARMNRIRSFVRKVEAAIASGDQNVAKAALRAAQPELMRGAKHGLIKMNTASRRVSRLAQRVKLMSA
ncbi:MAG: 30S ribosomal protein S20 [Alphaproteobacteria bacterium]|nr:30S ribosomal protein S20 [Alphaproteobacteria bacterium]